MRHLVLIILALATLLPSLAQAYDILVLQSSHNTAYDTVLKNFQTTTNASQRVIILSDYAEVNAARIVREDRPQLIFAIGDTAVTATSKIQSTPIVTAMALDISSRHNVNGVTVFAPPKDYLKLFKKLKANRVGIVYNPSKTGWYLNKARKAADQAGFKLEERTVRVPREVIAQLNSLAGKVDALWMLPDTTAVTRETTEAYFLFGQQHGVPVIAFASRYLGLGAAAILEIDPAAVGHQAGDMASALLGGASTPRYEELNHTTVKTNASVLRKFSLDSPL
ncbi:MAG: ABC transporter substrate binding protein [Desulfuromonadaceae bacterium]|nr:ABC transporter substrate binding protein [Desulfuromonadaceae bacterium]